MVIRISEAEGRGVRRGVAHDLGDMRRSWGPYLQLLLERVEGGEEGAGGWGGEGGAVEEGVQGVEAGEDVVDALLGVGHAGLGVGEQGVAQGGGRVHDLPRGGGK